MITKDMLKSLEFVCIYEGGEYETIVYPELVNTLKIVDIIFKKNVDIFFIKACKTLEIYNAEICKNSPFAYSLTQEEFDLLKKETKNYDKF